MTDEINCNDQWQSYNNYLLNIKIRNSIVVAVDRGDFLGKIGFIFQIWVSTSAVFLDMHENAHLRFGKLMV